MIEDDYVDPFFAGSLFFFFFSVNIMFSKYYGMENTKMEEMKIVDKRTGEMEIKAMKINLNLDGFLEA